MKVFVSVEERDCLKIQDACNIMNNCFQTAMSAMKSLSELYLSNKDLHKAQMVAAEMEQTKKNLMQNTRQFAPLVKSLMRVLLSKGS